MKTVGLLMTILVLAGCARTTGTTTSARPATITAVSASPGTMIAMATQPAAQPAGTGRYAGMVWTWDAERNIVTLNEGGQKFRVLVTPDQIARLRLHEHATVTGTLLGPDALETVTLPAQSMTAVPNGPATRAEVTGRISAIEPNGVAMVDSPRGTLRVWLAEGGQSRFAPGRPVKVDVTVQPVRLVPVASAGGQASAPTIVTSPAPAPTEPGDQAVVAGRILSITSTGTMSIDSPRGPIIVWVPDAASFRVGDFVQVRTVVVQAG
jgi:hypothetical protein